VARALHPSIPRALDLGCLHAFLAGERQSKGSHAVAGGGQVTSEARVGAQVPGIYTCRRSAAATTRRLRIPASSTIRCVPLAGACPLHVLREVRPCLARGVGESGKRRRYKWFAGGLLAEGWAVAQLGLA